eukprot:2161563-Prymnesium_polylepis.2
MLTPEVLRVVMNANAALAGTNRVVVPRRYEIANGSESAGRFLADAAYGKGPHIKGVESIRDEWYLVPSMPYAASYMLSAEKMRFAIDRYENRTGVSWAGEHRATLPSAWKEGNAGLGFFAPWCAVRCVRPSYSPKPRLTCPQYSPCASCAAQAN